MNDDNYLYRVVVRYDDPRGGIWHGPIESLEEANARVLIEAARVYGRAWVEVVGRKK